MTCSPAETPDARDPTGGDSSGRSGGPQTGAGTGAGRDRQTRDRQGHTHDTASPVNSQSLVYSQSLVAVLVRP